jgi:uncharacterized protein (DUF1778 family)
MITRKTSRTAAARRAAKRGERINLRANPDTKDLLVRAAALRGSNLTNRDRDRLLGALTEPPQPVTALRRLFHKQMTRAE